MRVVTNAGAAIPNLFAGGTDTMGMLLYDEYTDYGGCAQAWAFTSGRIAGANAALYALNAEDVTDSTSAAAAGALNSLVNTGLEIARINDTTFRLYGSAPYLPALCGALGDDPANGVNYAVLQLDAPEGAASATLVSTQLLNGGFEAAPYGQEAEASGERLEVVTLESGETGVVYLQRFVPGTTLAQGGTELTVDWNGTTVTYDLLYNSMSLGTMITDMSAALEDAGAANSGVTIVATGENTWTVSGGLPDGGVLNVLLEAPDPAAAYATVSVDGSVTEAPASRLLSTITAAPGDTVTVEAVWTAPASFWSGPVDYPVTYTFVVE